MPSKQSDRRSFEGFSKDADRFFEAVALNQDREWFKAHKGDYERLWLEPMKALLNELRPGLQKAFKGLKLGDNKHFRIYRDVRFSKDKSPYKTFEAAMIPIDTGGGASDLSDGSPAALYLHLGTADTVALGHWMLDGPQLAKYRQFLLDDKKGAAFAKKVQALEKKGFGVSAMESLKKPPKGIDPNHPRAWLLKHKGLGFDLPKIPNAVRHSPKLAKWILDQVKLAAPVVLELERARRTWK